MRSQSRGAENARVLSSLTLDKKKRAQGMPDAQCTRSLACEVKKHSSIVTTGTPKRSGTPCANGFNGFLRDLPGVRDFLVTVIGAMPSIVANLTPAKGRQDHTTSPSAHASFVCRGHSRPSHPAPNVRDDREAPLLWSAGRGELVKMICPTGIAKFFCEGDWTTQITLNRLMKLIFTRT